MTRSLRSLDLDLAAAIGRALAARLARTRPATVARLIQRVRIRRAARELSRTGGAVRLAHGSNNRSHAYLDRGLAYEGDLAVCGVELDATYGVSRRPGTEAPTCQRCRRLLAAAEARTASTAERCRRAA
jgi:hypothetical protein